MSQNLLKHKKVLCGFVLFIGVFILGFSKIVAYNTIKHSNRSELRNLYLSEDNDTECRNKTIDEFPKDFFTEKQNKNGAIVVHILIVFYLFGAIAIVTDEYFVKSLELMSANLKLKSDVVGSTFMAAGSSAPELFISLIGAVVAKSDVGLGTIVGSAIFNILFIIALCALVAKSAVSLNWYPLTRDSLFYSITIAALVIVIHDGKVYWYESALLFGLYLVYVVIMYFNNTIERNIKLRINKMKFYESEEEIEKLLASDSRSNKPIDRPNSITKLSEFNENGIDVANNNEFDDDDDDNEPLNPFKIPSDGLFKKLIWIIFLPTYILYYFTVPDCRRKIFSRFPFYFLTFLISTGYLAALSYVLLWMVVIIAYTTDIPDSVAGLTILAAGTSVPEIIASIIVIRKGKGDMAISNSIGSNIFDVLVCLSIPWFITSTLDKNSVIKIYSGGITYSTLILLSTVVGLIVLICLNKFLLTKKLGLLLFAFWLIVTVISCLFELNVFGKFSLPYCD